MRVLIVDDESNTREGLRDFVPWCELGICQIDTAADGIEALAVSQKTHPDIIISDIRMPNMDGITFIDHARKLNPDVKIILMSAYADKIYFKSAIEFRAISFVEKPINLNEITKAVKSAADLLNKERAIMSMILSSEEYAPKIVFRLASPDADIKDTLRDLRDINPNFISGETYCTLIVKTAVRTSGAIGSYTNTDSETESLRVAFRDTFSAHLLATTENKSTIIHISDKRLNGELSARRLFWQACELVNRGLKLQNGVFMSVGGIVNGLENIWKSYKSALDTMSGFFFSGYGSIIYAADQTAVSTNLGGSYAEDFENQLRCNDRAGAIESLEKLAQYVRSHRNLNEDSVRNTCFRLAERIPLVGKERNLQENNAENRDYIWKSVAEKETFEEINDVLLQKTIDFFSNFEYVSIRKPVSRIIMYIEQNYSRKTLSINDIAENIHLTPAHICHLFKKEMGKTINQYINYCRIENAKKRLKDHQLKLSDVAAQVGYSDANYFMRAFKKIIGQTPSEYREKYLLR